MGPILGPLADRRIAEAITDVAAYTLTSSADGGDNHNKSLSSDDAFRMVHTALSSGSKAKSLTSQHLDDQWILLQLPCHSRAGSHAAQQACRAGTGDMRTWKRRSFCSTCMTVASFSYFAMAAELLRISSTTPRMWDCPASCWKSSSSCRSLMACTAHVEPQPPCKCACTLLHVLLQNAPRLPQCSGLWSEQSRWSMQQIVAAIGHRSASSIRCHASSLSPSDNNEQYVSIKQQLTF